MPPAERVRAASQRRSETDYIFEYWSALGWAVLTLRIYGLYVLYQLVRRMREHNIRRLELFDASIAAAWEEAGRRGVQEELRPSFERAAGHLASRASRSTAHRMPNSSPVSRPAVPAVHGAPCPNIVPKGPVSGLFGTVLPSARVVHRR
ncbi:MAG: hypothetical protein QOH66_1390 [Actinomycetota bacterium]|nr:hypothetical protein [Actinomycetota bacterium]